MNVRPAGLPGMLVVEPKVARDERGYFAELWQETRYASAGLPGRFVQDNSSVSRHGTIRGLHLQHPAGQAKLISVPFGRVFDVGVDVRRGSPTFGQWEAVELSGENNRQLFLPEGVAHGLLVLSEWAVVSYKCTDYYAPDAELTLLWSDPDLDIEWPLQPRIISARDAAAPRLCDIPPERLPLFQPAPAESATSPAR